jgi:hypothetical protein
MALSAVDRAEEAAALRVPRSGRAMRLAAVMGFLAAAGE